MKIFRRNKPADTPAEPAGTAPPDGAQGELALADPTPAPRRPWPKPSTSTSSGLRAGPTARLASETRLWAQCADDGDTDREILRQIVCEER